MTNNTSPITTINMDEQKTSILAFFQKLPGAKEFSQEQINAFINLFKEREFSKGQTIVKEGDPIENIYIIISGEASIQKQNNPSEEIEIISTLNDGDYIGMTDRGFYSHTGQRTATVIAKTDVKLLELTINDFDAFLFEHPNLREKLSFADDLIMRMDFIRQLSIYTNLNFEEIKKLAEQTSEFVVEANTIIFEQGAEAEYCYLIRDGEVSISIQQDGLERKLSELSRGEIFGESALITDSVRNARAKTLTRCNLLRIDRTHFLEDILKNQANSKILAKLIHQRSRPEKISNASIHETKTRDGNIVYILKNSIKGNYCRLSKEGIFIWNQLNGKNTLHDIMLAIFDEFQILNPFITENVLLQLINSGFIKGYESEFYKRDTTKLFPWWIRGLIYFRRIMEFEYFFPSANDKLTRLYNSGFNLIYTPVGLTIIFLIAVVGLVAFISQFDHQIFMLKKSTGLLSSMVIYVIPISVISIILHELGHAFTTKAFGRDVHRFGIGWLWLTTRVMTDTSDMWLSPRGPRIAVDLAGLITNCFLAGITAIIMLFVSSPMAALFLWTFSFYTYLAVIQNLNPFYLLDGYYVLMDYFDNPNLRESAITWLTTVKFKDLISPNALRYHKAEIIYWFFGIGFIIFSSILFYYIQKYMFGSLSFQVKHPWFAFLLPTIFFVLATMSIWADILRRKMNPLNFN